MQMTDVWGEGSLTLHRWRVERTIGERAGFFRLRCRAMPLARPLSQRQREVVIGVARGRSNYEIAYALGVRESTVARHLMVALSRLGVPRNDVPLLAALSQDAELTELQLDLSLLFPELTSTQHDIVARVLLGASNLAIATQRSCAVRTVANHLRAIFDRLNVHSRLELSLLAALRSTERTFSAARSDASLAPRPRRC